MALGCTKKSCPVGLILELEMSVRRKLFCSILDRSDPSQKLPVLPSKKTTKRAGEGQESLILRQHSLWMGP